jgi:hypothetical protein
MACGEICPHKGIDRDWFFDIIKSLGMAIHGDFDLIPRVI